MSPRPAGPVPATRGGPETRHRSLSRGNSTTHR
jgi:hypothetical protein